MKARSLEPALLRSLESGEGERPVHAFLREHPYLVAMALNGCNNYARSVPDFRLGSDYVCDFIHFGNDSCGWEIKLIELEDPLERLYLKDGTPGKILRKAERQIADWKNWIRVNPAGFRSELAKLAQQVNAPPCSPGHPHLTASAEILDPRTHVDVLYHIVIGRREPFSFADNQRRAIDYDFHPKTIATYDRILDQARQFDSYHARAKELIRHSHRK